MQLKMGGNTCLTMITPSEVRYEVEVRRGVAIQQYQPVQDGDLFITTNQQDEIRITRENATHFNEHHLVALHTTILNGFASSINCEFINTEESVWIHAIHEFSKENYKPDALLSRHGLYHREDETGTPEIRNFRVSYRNNGTVFTFGKGIWKIRDMYNGILEWKLKYSETDRGKLYGYLQHLSIKDKMNRYRGVLLDMSKFLCVECHEANITFIVEESLTSPNSQNYIRSFLSYRNPWLRLLDSLCENLQVQLYVPDGRENAFLGAGRYGRCFSVKRRNSEEVLALKCVLTLNHYSFEKEVNALVSKEFEALHTLNNIPGVVRIIDGSLTVVRETINEEESDLGIGYLMNGVHMPINKEMCKRDKDLRKRIGKSLVAFHSRDPPIYHGDARYPNAVIDQDGRIIWVDWMCSAKLMTRENDVRTLVQSLYDSSVLTLPSVRELLRRYNIASTQLQLEEIMDAIMESDIS